MSFHQHQMIVVAVSSGEFELQLKTLKDNLEKSYQGLFIESNNTYGDKYLILLPDGSREGFATSLAFDSIRQEVLSLANSHGERIFELSFGDLGLELSHSLNGGQTLSVSSR